MNSPQRPGASLLARTARRRHRAIRHAHLRRLSDSYDAADAIERRRRRIALVQSDMLADWKGTPERDAAVDAAADGAVARRPCGTSSRPIDLIVWPETMFRQPWYVRDAKNPPPPGIVRIATSTRRADDLKAAALARSRAPLLGRHRPRAGVSERHDARPSRLSSCSRTTPQCSSTATGRFWARTTRCTCCHSASSFRLPTGCRCSRRYAPITGNSLWGEGPAAFESGRRRLRA